MKNSKNKGIGTYLVCISPIQRKEHMTQVSAKRSTAEISTNLIKRAHHRTLHTPSSM